MAVIETVTHEIHCFGGKEYPVTITKRKGLDQYSERGKDILADEATFCDYGPKLGTARAYTVHKEVPPTQAEREDGRRCIQQVAAQALIAQGIWQT